MNRIQHPWVATAILAVAASCTTTATEPPAPTPIDDPVPITGGTLAIFDDHAIISDPDLDRLFVVDLDGGTVRHDIQLEGDDEPGRVVRGPPGTAYVALRRGGAIVRLDVAGGTTERLPTCPAPRGLAYDGALHVACAGGELLTYVDEALTERLLLPPDLRDVVVTDTGLLVTRFRSAEVLHVRGGEVTRRLAPPSVAVPMAAGEFSAGVAWRAAPVSGGALVVHQRSPAANAYYHHANVVSSISAFGAEGTLESAFWAAGLEGVALPVDLAVDGNRVAVVGAGSHEVGVWTLDALQQRGPLAAGVRVPVVEGPVAAAFDDGGSLWVQTRDPATLQRFGRSDIRIDLPGPPRFQAGHALFHQAHHGTACASCHPEGQDDGRTWVSGRRTQTLAGGVGAVAPFHWRGEHADLTALMESVFIQRMGGPPVNALQVDSLARWLGMVPPMPSATVDDDAAVERGRALFHDQVVGCATCHAGPLTTTGELADVGRGELAIPTLQGLALRAPYMHDGCAPTLEARFTDESCGGGDAHGVTSHLDEAALADLVTYLRSL